MGQAQPHIRLCGTGVCRVAGFAQAQRGQRLWMLVLIYGGGIEILQLYVPGRSCEWGDLLADTVGITLGASLGIFITKSASSPRQ